MTLLLAAGTASAQPSAESKAVIFVDAGYARIADDEGFLGTGDAITVGAGYRVTPRLTLQAIVQRMPYHRNVEWLTFDGRAVFAGVEAAFQSPRPRVRPFVTAGAGMMNDDRIWLHKSQVGPGPSRVTERSDLRYMLSMMTVSGGLDFRVSRHGSVRASMRLHSLLDTGDDLALHTILQPAIGAACRW